MERVLWKTWSLMHSTNFHSTQSHVSKSLKVCVRVFLSCVFCTFLPFCISLRSPFSWSKLVESWAQDRTLDASSTSYFSPPMTTTQRRCVWVGRLWRSGAWFRMNISESSKNGRPSLKYDSCNHCNQYQHGTTTINQRIQRQPTTL